MAGGHRSSVDHPGACKGLGHEAATGHLRAPTSIAGRAGTMGARVRPAMGRFGMEFRFVGQRPRRVLVGPLGACVFCRGRFGPREKRVRHTLCLVATLLGCFLVQSLRPTAVRLPLGRTWPATPDYGVATGFPGDRARSVRVPGFAFRCDLVVATARTSFRLAGIICLRCLVVCLAPSAAHSGVRSVGRTVIVRTVAGCPRHFTPALLGTEPTSAAGPYRGGRVHRRVAEQLGRCGVLPSWGTLRFRFERVPRWRGAVASQR
ncbi:hypothetical protein HRbin30_02343 [bacterium HR30]|nr:hypothetical protein HRbin30_02343 [bacterium HR30]